MSAKVFETICVTASRSYDVVVGRGLLDEAGERIRATLPGADDICLVVTDDNVGPLYASRVAASLSAACFSTYVVRVPAGEPTKCLDRYGQLLSAAASYGLTRKSTVVALGGGVIGDLAGFVAATYMRGCNLIQIATSLLAMVDSSVGGKTAVDLPQGKNLVGAFYQPDLVLCDLDCLASLPPAYISDGSGEVVKYAVMADKELFGWLEQPLAGQEERVVARCVSIKRDVVEADEREGGTRKLLNLGHTVGHAIELLGQYKIPHGHCVAAGLAIMARACAAKGWCSAADAARIEAMLQVHGLPTATEFSPDELCEAATHDKKRVGDAIDIVIVRDIGDTAIRRVSVEEFNELVYLGCTVSLDDLDEGTIHAEESCAHADESSAQANADSAQQDDALAMITGRYDAVIKPGQLSGSIEAISSKSDAHRMLICAALSDAPTHIRCTTSSHDIEATCDCLRALGADITRVGDEFIVVPIDRTAQAACDHDRDCSYDLGRDISSPSETAAGMTSMFYPGFRRLPCGESGSTLRFMLPVACALGIDAAFIREGRLGQRPLEPLRSQLIEHGCTISDAEASPLHTQGRLKGGTFDLPGNISSQYVTGLLLALPLTDEGGRVRLSGTVESRPYIDLTIAVMRKFGVEVTETSEPAHGTGSGDADATEEETALTCFTVASDASYHSPGTAVVEGDWSNAAFWLCAGALSTAPVTVSGLDLESIQGDRAVVDKLKAFGVQVEVGSGAGAVTVCGADEAGSLRALHGITIDAHDVPDLVPVLAVVASHAEGETHIINAARLRMKESDRLNTTACMLRSLGVSVEELPDGLIINSLHSGDPDEGSDAAERARSGCDPSQEGSIRISADNDHRIAMAASVAATVATCPVTIVGANAVAKSYPDFYRDFKDLGGRVRLISDTAEHAGDKNED